MDHEDLSEDRAAEQLGISVLTLRNWRWRKQGPAFYRIGRRITYHQVDIDAWKQAQRHVPTAS